MVEWLPAPEGQRLAPGEVHVWRVELGAPEAFESEVLSPDEIERARRFHFERDRNRFVTARARLRSLLGRYTGTQPREIVFRYGDRGKPRLAGGRVPVEFNLAHSGDLALCALVLGNPLGIDVELVRAGPAEEGIAEWFFSRREAEALRSLPAAAQREAFFRCWTRKEAFVKANGEGLAFGLDQFSVTLLPDEPAEIVELPGGAGDTPAWSLHHLDPGAPFVGALAVQGRGHQLRCWRYETR